MPKIHSHLMNSIPLLNIGMNSPQKLNRKWHAWTDIWRKGVLRYGHKCVRTRAIYAINCIFDNWNQFSQKNYLKMTTINSHLGKNKCKYAWKCTIFSYSFKSFKWIPNITLAKEIRGNILIEKLRQWNHILFVTAF